MKRALAGLRPWLLQRLTALYMLVFILYLLAHFLLDPPHSRAVWRGWILAPVMSIAAATFLGALFLHAWVGVRDVILDYVHPVGFRVAALAVLGSGLMAMAVWAVRILLIARL